jgi:5-(aminomethyl)-3-furanmethanol phosphate kinase
MRTGNGLTVVKVGGSLYDLPDLGARLWSWLDTLQTPRVLLVPGGGAAADVIRDLDACHALGAETAHELALRSLTLNAWFLSALLEASPARAGRPFLPVLNPLAQRLTAGFSILDAQAFWTCDRLRPGALPACWNATSDSVAARVATVLGAVELILLKSVALPEPCNWEEAGRRGIVDPLFTQMLSGISAQIVNLRDWQHKEEGAGMREEEGTADERR